MALKDNFKEGLIDYVTSLVTADKANISEAIFKKTAEVSDITTTHTIVTGVRDGSLVPIIQADPNYESFHFTDEKSCDVNECEIETLYSNKKWELGLIECRIPICMRSFEEDFHIFWNQFRVINPDVTDMNTTFGAYLTKRVKDGLLASQWRTLYFGDTTSQSTLFNGFNGFFTQAELGGGLNLAVAENKATTLAEQKMTGERVYETLSGIYEQAVDTDWFEEEKAVIKMTKFMAQPFIQYLNKLADKAPVCCDILNPDSVTQRRRFMLDNLSFHGIPVVVHKELDGVIKGTSELNGGGITTPRVDPNRALLTTKENLMVGTSQTKDLNYFDVFYDKKDKKIYIDANSYHGACLPTDEYIMAGLKN